MRARGYGRVRRKILCSMIIVPFVPFLLSLVVGYTFFIRAIETNTNESMRRVVADHAQLISSFMAERLSDLQFVINTYPIESLDDPTLLDTVFQHLQTKSPAFVDLGIIDAKGHHLAYVGPYSLKSRDYSASDWFQQVRKNGVYISDVYLGFRNVPHFVVAVSRRVNGDWWVLRAAIDTKVFSHLVEAVRIGETGEAYLLNRDGVLQTDRRSGGKVLDKAGPDIPDAHEGIRLFVRDDASGDESLYATTWIGKGATSGRWQLVVRQEKADAYHDVQQATYIILAILLAGVCVIVGLALYVSGSIERTLDKAVSDKEHLQDQLIRAARLAELGEMAAGFAHEINNPLQIMKSDLAYMEMLLADFQQTGELPDEDREEIGVSMEQVKLQISRCASITQSILKFGRQSEPQTENINLRTFVTEVLGMVERKAQVNGVEVHSEIDGDENGGTPHVLADPGQLQQVVLNLFNNALDAIHERHGVSGGLLNVHIAAVADGTVQIEVIDNGAGISQENLDKVFAPFFTTKPPGKGTGLGLSVCYGIVQSMGGNMEVHSEKNVGTTFTISLPEA
ncbi:MAG: sensor histidine kinase [Desulfovibrio sp.]|uniref:sensor histidine kinase n=1 Tax=Desulfovibrio sp. 7SRBS1 TaxID=3378064 RepID=UPI003B3F48EA